MAQRNHLARQGTRRVRCLASTLRADLARHYQIILRFTRLISITMSMAHLPLEMILPIIEPLSPQSKINFALTHYSVLYGHGLVPSASPLTISRLCRRRKNFSTLPPVPGLSHDAVLKTMEYLQLWDLINFALAIYC